MASYCINCGSSIRYSERYCKKCGNKSPEEKVKEFKCPVCGNLVGISDFCGNCGFKLNKDLYYSIKESGIKACPKCSNKNNLDAEFCGNCGETLPIVSNLELIKCPDCGKFIREDVNYCRFCGHDLITNKKSLFKGRFKSREAYCQNCGKKTTDLLNTNFCVDCGTFIPSNTDIYSTTTLSHEKYQLIFINRFIVPLSEAYNVNFRKTTLSQYFNITPSQESHIIFLIMNKLVNEDLSVDSVELFRECLEETVNHTDTKTEALSFIKTKLTNAFNNKGISIEDVETIEGSYYKTVETPVIQNKHGGLAKGAATLGFGLVGLAATSGVKQTTSTKKVLQKGKYTHRRITVKDKHIVLKTYQDTSLNLGFNHQSDNITKVVFNWNDIDSLDDEYFFIFKTGETLKCPVPDVTEWTAEGIMRVLGTTDLNTNLETNKEWLEELKPDVNQIFFELIRNRIKEAKNNFSEKVLDNNTNVDELEKVMKMYQEGLLTDDEFATMKQNIIGTVTNDSNFDNIESSPKFCGNCGSKIVKDSKFCTQCGNPLNDF